MLIPERKPGMTCGLSNTGPLISAFQSESFEILTEIFMTIITSTTCISELKEHGWEAEIRAAGSDLVCVALTSEEKRRAITFARQIADQDSPITEKHTGEAEIIVVALRPEFCHDVLLLDELAARDLAKHVGINISGFPGVLLSAVQSGLISAENLKARLEKCREQGTHYGEKFIQDVYNMAKHGWR